MNFRKFVGIDSRAALQAVKRDMGADAVILSNRIVEGGVEITAMPAEGLRESGTSDFPSPLRLCSQSQVSGDEKPPVIPVWANGMLAEIRALRDALQDQLGTLAWGNLKQREPTRAYLLHCLLRTGFGPGLARYLIENLPADADTTRGMQWLHAVLAKNIQCAQEEEIVAKGGVFALMGPTGVGKTTTTAKLAARCVVQYGAGQVALITTDSYRIGAYEHLRIYGRILGVPVHVVGEAADLRVMLADLSDRRVILIDTVGMSQRDQMVTEQAGMLHGAGSEVNRLLLLSACCSTDVLDETVKAYRGEHGLAGVILTKLDEAVGLGAVLDTIIRHQLRLFFVSNGQRVPEDLHSPNKEYLVHRALQFRPADQALDIQDTDVPVLLNARQGMHCGPESTVCA